jgi:hypothetical protein
MTSFEGVLGSHTRWQPESSNEVSLLSRLETAIHLPRFMKRQYILSQTVSSDHRIILDERGPDGASSRRRSLTNAGRVEIPQ